MLMCSYIHAPLYPTKLNNTRIVVWLLPVLRRSQIQSSHMVPCMDLYLCSASAFLGVCITGYGSTLYIGIDMVFCILPIH